MSGPGGSRPLRLAYAGFAAIGLAVVGALVYERSHAPPAAPAAGLRPVGAPTTAPAMARIPERRPDFVLNGLDGRARRLSDWSGHALLVNFWATWCAPCRREIPLLNRLRDEYAPRGLEVVGVAVDFAADVRAYAKDFPIHYPLLVGEQDGLDAARAFGVQTMAFPFSAFVTAHGDVLVVHLGELHEAQARAILAVVADVDAGRSTAAAGRAALERTLDALPPATATAAH